MGSTFKLSSLSQNRIEKLLSPVVFCTNGDKILPYTKVYEVLSINAMLSNRLIDVEQDKRTFCVLDEFNSIIEESGEPLLIRDFEILFNPDYEIDVLKMFVLANRKKKITVLWCGTYEDGKLIFAEPDYRDYKSYSVKDYDISCII